MQIIFYLINEHPNSPRPLLHTVLVSQKYHREIFSYRRYGRDGWLFYIMSHPTGKLCVMGAGMGVRCLTTRSALTKTFAEYTQHIQ